MEKFNIQMFANPNTNVTTDKSVGNDLSPTMKTFYKTALLENARQENYFNQFGKKQALPKNGGNKVEWRKFDTFERALTPLTEGVTPDGNKVNMIRIEKAIDQFGDYTTISDRLELEAVDPIIMGVTEEHAAQAGETLDTVTRNELVTGTHVYYGGTKDKREDLEATDVLTPTLINKVFTHLKKMKAPKIDGDYIFMIHPSCTFDLRESDGWLEAHEYAKPEEIYNGEIGKLHGFRFVESTNVKVVEGGKDDIAVYLNEAFGKDAYGIIEPSAESMEVIVKQRGSAGTSDPLNQRGTVGWKASHAAKILYQERLCRVEVGSSFSDIDKAN